MSDKIGGSAKAISESVLSLDKSSRRTFFAVLGAFLIGGAIALALALPQQPILGSIIPTIFSTVGVLLVILAVAFELTKSTPGLMSSTPPIDYKGLAREIGTDTKYG